MTLAAGIDVGGTKMLGVVVDLADPATVLRSARRPTPRGGEALVADLVGLVDELGIDPPATLGLGIPGLVDHDGVLRVGPNLPDVGVTPFGRLVGAATGLPVRVDNDATCATLAEFHAGAAVGHGEGLMLTIGTGIGAGIVTGGRVLHGANGFAGEPGHMVIDPSGPRCPCGRRGCWERFASGSGLGRLAREAAMAGRLAAVVDAAGGDPEDVKGEHVVSAARHGDPDAGEVLDEFAWWMAVGIANLVDILDPSAIVLGGGVMEAADVLLHRVQAAVPDLVLAAEHRPEVPLLLARFGDEAGAVGAAFLGAGQDS